MAGTLVVQNLQGPTSGANANKVIIPSGQTLDASAGGFTTPPGHVIQVVTGKLSSAFNTSSTTAVDTGLSATITPTSASNKILIVVTGDADRPGVASECPKFAINRGATEIYGGTNFLYSTGSFDYSQAPVVISYLDSPASTSSLTYKVTMKVRIGNTCAFCGAASTGTLGVITVMEIAG